MLFDSRVKTVGRLVGSWVVKDEPMVFGCDYYGANRLGGQLTKNFTDFCLRYWGRDSNFIIDSRTQMLMSGWYPCIPGWHLDDVPRERLDKQPNHYNPSYKAEHLAVFLGPCSKTLFAVGEIELVEPPIGHTIYTAWHPEVELSNLKKQEIQPGNIVAFNWQSFHKCQQATENGWRFWIRATRYTHRPFTNEQRTSVNIYIPTENQGW